MTSSPAAPVDALSNGEIVAASAVRPEFADALQRTVFANTPMAALEIGLAGGVSAVAIMTGLRLLPGNRTLTSIDPYQRSDFQNAGLARIRRAGMADMHTLIEQPDYLALPQLLASGQRFQFAYIDGWHTFDYTLLDFWYIDRMLDIGGIVAFNDCHLKAVTRVCGFVTSHRDYVELDVGLPGEYGSNLLQRIKRKRERRNGADRYFRKQSTREPDWSFYAPF